MPECVVCKLEEDFTDGGDTRDNKTIGDIEEPIGVGRACNAIDVGKESLAEGIVLIPSMDLCEVCDVGLQGENGSDKDGTGCQGHSNVVISRVGVKDAFVGVDWCKDLA